MVHELHFKYIFGDFEGYKLFGIWNMGRRGWQKCFGSQKGLAGKKKFENHWAKQRGNDEIHIRTILGALGQFANTSYSRAGLGKEMGRAFFV